MENLTTSQFNIKEVQQLAAADLDFFCGLTLPDVYKYAFPPVYLVIWDMLLEYVHKERDFSKIALGLPRGFSKTTVIKLFCVYAILFTDKKFILVVGATASLAEKIIGDIIDMLDEPNIKAVFGDWRAGVERNSVELKQFGFRGKSIVLAAVGSEGNVRGLNVRHARPDIIVFDDLQTKENAESPILSDKLFSWMLGTAMKTKSPTGCLTLFVGNMYATKWSILKYLKSNPVWIKFIVGGILADGTSLWEELQPLEQLIKEYKSDEASGKKEIFFAEVLNDENAAVNTQLDVTAVPEWGQYADSMPECKFIIIDPSNDKHNSDAVAIGYFESYDNKPALMDLISETMSPGDIIRTSIELCIKHGCKLVIIESVAFQYSLLYWSSFIMQQLGLEGITFVDIYPGSQSKSTRIRKMFKELLAGEVLLHTSVRARVLHQASGYNVLKQDNVDDILDLLAYSKRALDLYGNIALCDNELVRQEVSTVCVIENNTAF